MSAVPAMKLAPTLPPHLSEFSVSCVSITCGLHHLANCFFVIVPPDPPHELKVVEKTTSTIKISWKNPDFTGFASITSFRIKISDGETERSDEFEGNQLLTEYTALSLSPLTFYTISLFVVTDAGLQSLPGMVQEMTVSLSEQSLLSVMAGFIFIQYRTTCGRAGSYYCC